MLRDCVPKYYVLRQELLKKIESGAFPEGEPITSERELIDRYKFSRTTVRKAIDELVNEGYLYRLQGKGTFVKGDTANQNLYCLTSCSEDVRRMNKMPAKKLVFSEKLSADVKQAKRLNLSVGDSVYSFGRITYADNEPLNYTINFLPEQLFPQLDQYDFEKVSLYNTIQQEYGVTIEKARRTVEAVLPSPIVARYLEINPDMPVILFECVTYGKSYGKEVPIESFRCYYRTDHYKFYIDQINTNKRG